jgi:hypothetical protein
MLHIKTRQKRCREPQVDDQAGMVRQLAAGCTFIYLGLRVLEKVNTIIRQKMNAVGAGNQPAHSSPAESGNTGTLV